MLTKSLRKLCGHHYDATSIREFLARGSRECPATGCRKQIKLSDLEQDKELAKRAAHAARREREKEEDRDSADDEEIIE